MTVRGAAIAAGLAVGVWPNTNQLPSLDSNIYTSQISEAGKGSPNIKMDLNEVKRFRPLCTFNFYCYCSQIATISMGGGERQSGDVVSGLARTIQWEIGRDTEVIEHKPLPQHTLIWQPIRALVEC